MRRANRWRRGLLKDSASPEEITYRSLLHIGDEWVRAAIAEVRPESVLIVGAAKEPRIDAGPDIAASSLAPVCEDALRRAEDMTQDVIGQAVVPDEALLSLSAGSARSVKATVQVARSEPNKEIGQREINHLLQELHRAVEGQAAVAEPAAGGGRELARSLVLGDIRLAETSVDGHLVTSPLQFRGSTLEATASALFLSPTMMEELHWLVTYLELSARLVAVPWALAAAMSEQEPSASDLIGCLVDTRESTLFRLRRGTVVAMESCAFGSHDLLGDLGVSLGVPRFRADDLCQAYCAGELEEDAAAQVGRGMAYAERRWCDALAEPFARLSAQEAATTGLTRLWYWQMAPAWPGLEYALGTWAGAWSADRLSSVTRGNAQSIPGVSDRTGLIDQEPAGTFLAVLAHHAGYLSRASDPLNAALRRIALRD